MAHHPPVGSSARRGESFPQRGQDVVDVRSGDFDDDGPVVVEERIRCPAQVDDGIHFCAVPSELGVERVRILWRVGKYEAVSRGQTEAFRENRREGCAALERRAREHDPDHRTTAAGVRVSTRYRV